MRLGMGALQVFTKNQRQWSAPPLTQEQIDAWNESVKATRWSDPHKRIVSHNSYLVNLASPDAASRSKSIRLQRDELERCECLGIGSCVLHPGAHLGAPRKPTDLNNLRAEFSRDETDGLKRIAQSLDRLHKELPGFKVISCLETTTGAGTNLGYDFAHLARIRSLVREPERVGICMDTCHVVAAGYDMSSATKAKAVLDELESICGVGTLRAVHINDSVGACGSRKDRHAHIGQGCCGEACFREVLTRKSLEEVPMLLETPKEDEVTGEPTDPPLDLVNIAALERIRLGKRVKTA